MGKNYSGLLNSLFLFGNSQRSFSWSRPSLLNLEGNCKTSTAAASKASATDTFPVSCGKAILIRETKQSVSSRLNSNSRFTTNFQKTAFSAVLLFMISTIGACAKNVHIAKAVSTSSTTLVKNNTIPSLADGTFSHTKSMHFYTYIYVPILQIQNKGDCMKEGPLIKPLTRCNNKINIISQNSIVANPNKNISNLILNT